jgi:hypothetical protein
MLRAHQKLISTSLEKRGLGVVSASLGQEESERVTLTSNYHHLGTTRMHSDPSLAWSMRRVDCIQFETCMSPVDRFPFWRIRKSNVDYCRFGHSPCGRSPGTTSADFAVAMDQMFGQN